MRDMNPDAPYNLRVFRGRPYDAGFAVGRSMGSRVAELGKALIETWPPQDGVIDRDKLLEGAAAWVATLPERYRADEVEAVLDRWERTRGMILFVVDGRMRQAAAFDCTCRTHRRRRSNGGTWIATNHYMDIAATELAVHGESVARLHRIEGLLSSSDVRDGVLLRTILADDGVERRSRARTTVFSTIACPSTGEMWFACGTGPAASERTWSQVPWPWDKGGCDPSHRAQQAPESR